MGPDVVPSAPWPQHFPHPGRFSGVPSAPCPFSWSLTLPQPTDRGWDPGQAGGTKQEQIPGQDCPRSKANTEQRL